MRAVAGIHLDVGPTLGLCPFGKGSKYVERSDLRAIDVCAAWRRNLRVQRYCLSMGEDWLRYSARQNPGAILVGGVWWQRVRGNLPAFVSFSCLPSHPCCDLGRQEVKNALAVSRYERINVNELINAGGKSVRDGSGDHSSIAVSDEDDFLVGFPSQ